MDDTIVLRLEFITIYFLIPIILLIVNLKPLIFVSLILVSAYAYFILKKDKIFDFKILLKKVSWKKILIFNLIFTVNIYLYTIIFFPNLLFTLPKTNFNLWIVIIIFYPILSAFPQEFIYRVFFFHRYKILFNRNINYLIIMNTIFFTFGHIIFLNFTSLLFTAVASPIFAIMYLRYSFFTCLLLHSFSGLLVFSFGLGRFFY